MTFAVQAERKTTAINLHNAALWIVALLGVFIIGLTLWGALGLRTTGGVFYVDEGAVHTRSEAYAGTVSLISGAGLSLVPETTDLVHEPDTLPDYAAYDRFIERQDIYQRMLNAGDLKIIVDGEPVNLMAGSRSLTQLPPAFWAPFLTGILVFFIGGTVWALKPGAQATQLLFINALGLAMSALPLAVYGARPLAIEGEWFRSLMSLNHAGAQLFGSSILALLLIYPKSLVRPFWAWVMLASFVPLFAADQLRLLGIPGGSYAIHGIETLGILCLLALQAYVTRHEPSHRAALLWLGMSIGVGTCLWVVIVTLYAASGDLSAMPEAYAFLSFLLIYMGLAFAVSRFRLFEISDWAFRALFFVVAAVVFVMVDAGLVYVAHMEQAPAMTFAVLLTAFGYLPLRDYMWRRFVRMKQPDDQALFASVFEIVYAPSPEARAERWSGLIQSLFQPRQLEIVPLHLSEVEMLSEGQVMRLPSLIEGQALSLSRPRYGVGLFTPAHLRFMKHVLELVSRAISSREAYERGATEERRKVAQDLHDDVGARLLSGLVVADERTRPIFQAALADIRAISTAMLAVPAPLENILASARHEAAERLEAADIGFVWDGWPDEPSLIGPQGQKALLSGLREIVSNTIRHSAATQVTVRVEHTHDTLYLEWADNGRGLMPDSQLADGTGQGLRGIRQRFADAGGTVAIKSEGGQSEGGVCFSLRLPLIVVPSQTGRV
ncbi:sensor histidine kinase [Asticcacaulis tiandongensis]|uniref:sensor histidine kinase n=1 Tax=Asticcacaulis tiandongensis TaxID=2565365 RepID=UPI0011285B86|nr:ATP-binding protein [Asticcacaulis tiandongensis]